MSSHEARFGIGWILRLRPFPFRRFDPYKKRRQERVPGALNETNWRPWCVEHNRTHEQHHNRPLRYVFIGPTQSCAVVRGRKRVRQFATRAWREFPTRSARTETSSLILSRYQFASLANGFASPFAPCFVFARPSDTRRTIRPPSAFHGGAN